MDKSVFAKLVGSSKFVVALAVIAAIVVLASLSKISGADALTFIRDVVLTWIGAQALQTGAEKIGAGIQVAKLDVADQKEALAPPSAPLSLGESK